eukprot:1736935-Alexandrium_andersonii.AAC.1
MGFHRGPFWDLSGSCLDAVVILPWSSWDPARVSLESCSGHVLVLLGSSCAPAEGFCLMAFAPTGDSGALEVPSVRGGSERRGPQGHTASSLTSR